MKKTILFLLCLWGATAIAQTEKTPEGIIVTLPQAKQSAARKVRVQVITDRIFRVSATPEEHFSDGRSLIILPRQNIPLFRTEENGDDIRIVTDRAEAVLNKKTGAITFRGRNGKVLLQENGSGGKAFIPSETDGDQGYAFRQVFESPEDESFYGLGQHQSDEFDYKGKNETLYQYNTKVSVPFVLSSKGYGLLWDNYSLTRFGDPREYGQLSQFRLYGTDGTEGGLTASYYPQEGAETGVIRRLETEIDYETLDRLDAFPPNFKFGRNSRVTWEGEIEPQETGLHRFILYYAGYTKLFLDGKPVVRERWRTAWNPNSYKFAVALEKGKRHRIRLEWKPDGGASYIGLKALGPVPKTEQEKLSLWSELGDMIDYYFIAGDTPDEIISGYRTLTGKSPIMPRWAMGYWQSRERYKTVDELLETVREYRKRRIPLDNIVLDWSYWPEDAWGSHEFDATRFPDPEGMADSVHRMNARIMISVWPKFYHTTQHYREFDRNGWMYRKAVQDSIRDWIGKGYIGSFYDAYAPEARQLFWEQMKEHLYSKGIDAWWMDASEPDIHSNRNLTDRKALSGPTALGSSTRYLNTYALMNAQAIYEGQRSTDPDKRVFLLTRSGFAGLQRYAAATWSGDIGTRWEDLKAQISAGLNYALSGIPYWTMDVGGFCVEHRYEKAAEGSEDREEWRELNARWHQFGAFCPLYRSHGQYPYREMYHIAPETHPAYRSMVHYDRLRYRLMPYIYTLAGMTWHEDYTLMRALVMDFGADPKTHGVGDQFLMGPFLMAAPVYEYKARSREVYFPAGCGWYDFYTGEYVGGGQRLTVDAPYERMPLYVREGAILPFGPEIQHTGEKPADPLTVFVCTGKDGAFTLYEDDGVTYAYERGEYMRIPFAYDERRGVLTVGDREGTYEGMPNVRNLWIVAVSKNRPKPFDLDTKEGIAVAYTGKRIEIRLR